MREGKLRRGVNWQGALKQKGLKQGRGVHEGLAVLFLLRLRAEERNLCPTFLFEK
jgi:hypothetical protein